ncbi:hypothetical protein GQ457_02G009770 [Hibiscus cannabinus]
MFDESVEEKKGSMMINPKACFSKNIRNRRWIFFLCFLFQRLVSQNIRSGRLRTFAFAGLESLCCFIPSLDV